MSGATLLILTTFTLFPCTLHVWGLTVYGLCCFIRCVDSQNLIQVLNRHFFLRNSACCSQCCNVLGKFFLKICFSLSKDSVTVLREHDWGLYLRHFCFHFKHMQVEEATHIFFLQKVKNWQSDRILVSTTYWFYDCHNAFLDVLSNSLWRSAAFHLLCPKTEHTQGNYFSVRLRI